MVRTHTIFPVFRMFSSPSIWENHPDCLYIISSANKVTRDSGILKETSCYLIFFSFNSALSWSPKPKQSFQTNSKNQRVCSCRIADLSKQEAPTNISVRKDVNQPQCNNQASMYYKGQQSCRSVDPPFYNLKLNRFHPIVLLYQWRSLKVWETLAQIN